MSNPKWRDEAIRKSRRNMESRRQNQMVEEMEQLKRRERKKNGNGVNNSGAKDVVDASSDEKKVDSSVCTNKNGNRKENRRQRFRRIMLELYNKVKEPENGYDSFCFHFNQ